MFLFRSPSCPPGPPANPAPGEPPVRGERPPHAPLLLPLQGHALPLPLLLVSLISRMSLISFISLIYDWSV